MAPAKEKAPSSSISVDNHDKKNNHGELIKFHLVTIIMLTLFSLGIFSPIWFLIQRNRLNHLKSVEKIRVTVFVVIIILLLVSVIIFILSLYIDDPAMIDDMDIVSGLIEIVCGILLILQAFKVRQIIHQHFKGHLGHKIRLHGPALFFLTTFYLQYKINRLDYQQVDDGKQPEPS